ncbi:hypothetical protein Dda_6146 [Drechslerella dactyloides]|uniref:Carboxymuconolactone decarboxylase-like domain-containing protein n=1 Tax=Drechslerella dactyloides TaxID=74499 RepID=A0AAD6IVR3_DREDA|nr:hypothetical protein Dda_6146 [Drechslerella dactyloides]
MSERYPAIVPEALDSDQKVVHEYLTREIGQYFQGTFTFQSPETGALVGPYTHFLYLPQKIAAGYVINGTALSSVSEFPLKCREIAILAIGEHYGAKFELYSHVRVAKKVGLSNRQIEDLLAGLPPTGGTEQELISWEVARALISAKGPIPAEMWKRAEGAFGKEGAGALIHFVGFYAYTSIILNGADNHINKNLNESLTKAIPFASIVEYDGVADFYVRKLDDWTRAVMEDKYYMDELVPDALIFGDFAGARVTVGEEYVVIDDGRIIQEHVHQYERPSHAPGLSQEPPSQTVG